MKFSSREDIEAPADFVFEQLCRFERFERSAMRRGAEVQRLDDIPAAGIGMRWAVSFEMRGRMRHLTLEMTEFDRPRAIKVISVSNGIYGEFLINLMALSPRMTRLSVSLDVSPKTLAARLMIQSIRLAKGSVSRRFKQRVADFGARVEESYRSA
ncbi:MAG: SRPBCC family protein [Paracoccaceae bacterium]